jgi:hypothetical protein
MAQRTRGLARSTHVEIATDLDDWIRRCDGASVLLRPKAGTTSPRPEFPGRMPAQEPCGRGGTRLRTRERRLIVNLPAGPQDIELDAGTWS